eukprot:SAG11_NODE_38577_length_251_cov_2.296053_1_plen_29_part_10
MLCVPRTKFSSTILCAHVHVLVGRSTAEL